MNISHFSFVWKVGFSNEKYIRVKIQKLWEKKEKKISGIREKFANTLTESDKTNNI